MIAGTVYSFYFSVTNSDATLNPPIWYAISCFLNVPKAFLQKYSAGPHSLPNSRPDAAARGRPTVAVTGETAQDMTSQWTGIVRGVTDGATALLVVLPTFTTSMGQTTIVPLNPNSLTITLAVNIQLTVPPATAITLSGLKGTATPSSAVLPITQNIGSATFLPTAYWTESSGTLILNVSTTLAQGTQVTVTFAVTNGYEPQNSPAVSITSYGEVAVPAAAVTPSANGDAQPLYIVGFTTRIAAQSTPSSAALNTITVSFAFNRHMSIAASSSDYYSNPSITISGLTNSLSPTIQLLPDQSGFPYQDTWRTDGSAAPTWDQSTGTLILWPAQDIAKLYVYTVNFLLQNPPFGQNARNVTVSIGTTFSVYLGTLLVEQVVINDFSSQLMHNAPGILAPLLILDFLLATIGQGAGTPSAGLPNTLTVTITVRASIATTGALTIAGLDNAVVAAGPLAIKDASGDSSCGQPSSCNLFFSSAAAGAPGYGRWEGNGTLVLFVVKTIPAGAIVKFSFVVTNPLAGQLSPSISVQSNGLNAVVSVVAMQKDTGNAQPLAVAGFNSSLIRQSTQSQGGLNTLTISLQPFTTLLSGAFVTITNFQNPTLDPASGLVLSLNPICNLSCPFNASNTPAGVAGLADWVYAARTASLSFYLLSPIAAASTVSFSFQVRNPSAGQDAPSISIGVLGTDSVVTQTLLPSPRGAFEVLRVAGFKSSYVSQSKAVFSFTNNITISFTAFNVFAAQPPSYLTIGGLVGTFDTGQKTVRSIQNAYVVSGGIISSVLSSTSFGVNFNISNDPGAGNVSGSNYSGYYLAIRNDLRQITSFTRKSQNTTISVQVTVASQFSSPVVRFTTFKIATYPNYIFNSSGAWNITTGQLVVPIVADSDIAANYSFYFQVKNPNVIQSGVTVWLGSSEIYIATISMTEIPGILQPLYIGG